MKKRILSVLLVLCMVVGLLPAVALAAEEDWTTVTTVAQLSEALQTAATSGWALTFLSVRKPIGSSQKKRPWISTVSASSAAMLR